MLHISLLDEQCVAAGGEPILGLSPRTLGLLGFLAVHAGAPQLRAHVAVVFWPDSTEKQARTNLRRELHQLRRALPEAERCLDVDASAVCWRLDAPAVVDVVEFGRAADEADRAERDGDRPRFATAASHAVRSYGGPLMPAYYDDWVLAERARLQRRCVSLLDRLAPALASRGDETAAISAAQRRVALEPLEEAGHRALMALQVDTGDRAAALRTFRRCAEMLERELGLTPSPETLSLHRSAATASDRNGVAGEPGSTRPLAERADPVSRLESLPAPAPELFELIVTAGRPLSLDLLVEASGRPADEVIAAMEQLWAADLLREGPRASYEPADARLRGTMYDTLSPPVRQRRHQALADALEALHADDLRPVAADLCEHHCRAGHPDRAVEYHWVAARAAAEVHDHETAVRHHREALSLLDQLGEVESPRRADALGRLGTAQRAAGDPAHRRTLLDTGAMARRHLATDVLVRSALAASDDGYWSSSFTADPERAGLVRAALDLVPDRGLATRAVLSARLAMECHLALDHTEAGMLIEEAEALAERIDEPRPRLDVLTAAAYVRQDPDSIRTMPEVARRCVELAARLGDRVRLVHELLRYDVHLRKVGRTGEADVALRRAEALAEPLDHPPTRFWILNGRLARALITGDADAAEQLVEETAAAGREAGFPDADRRALYASFSIHLLRGRLGDVAPPADALPPPGHIRPLLDAGRSLLVAHAGRTAEARTLLRELTGRIDDLPPLGNPHLALALLARTAHHLGERASAALVLDHLRPHAGLVLYAGAAALGTSDHALGLAAAAAGDRDEAAAHLRRAAELERRAGMHGWLVRTEVELHRLGT